MEQSNINKPKKKEDLGSWMKTLLIYLSIGILLRVFVLNITFVSGDSMFPNLHDHDRILTFKLGYSFEDPKRGDIIVFPSPVEKKDYIKRVIGVSGDRIRIENGIVYLNDEELMEPYLDGIVTQTYQQTEWKVQENQLFVMGDNRGASHDSRAFGVIDRNTVIGKAVFILFPFDRWTNL